MISAIAIILVLGGLIFFHELGHFVVARTLGIGVRTFSLGFGPKLLGFRRGATEYRLSAVPLGGYVHLAGESAGQELPEGFTLRESFIKRPAWQRMLVVAAGPIANLLLAWIIYWGLLWAYGQMELRPVVGQLAENAPAAVAGIQPQDRIVAIDGRPIRYWRELAEIVQESRGPSLRLTVERGRETLAIDVRPEMQVRKNLFGEEVRIPVIGVIAGGEIVHVPLRGHSAALAGLARTWDIIVLTVQGIGKLIERIIPFDTVAGPVLIAQLISEQAKEGLGSVLALTALISVNLGLLNLLPIPVLDGGYILFFGIEALLRRPVNRRVQEVTTKAGLAVLIALFALVLYNDLQRVLFPVP